MHYTNLEDVIFKQERLTKILFLAKGHALSYSKIFLKIARVIVVTKKISKFVLR